MTFYSTSQGQTPKFTGSRPDTSIIKRAAMFENKDHDSMGIDEISARIEQTSVC
jgi:hypothetical protein